MGLDLRKIKIELVGKIRRLTSELTLRDDQKQILRDLFSSDEARQMNAAMAIGKSSDIRLLCMMQFYLHDDFLDEFLAHVGGKEMRYEIAQKKMIKFYSLVAASSMLSNDPFYRGVMGVIQSGAEPAEERCDLIYMLGLVFESFGQEIHSRDAAFVSDKVGGLFVGTLLGILESASEADEIKVASAMALRKTIQNPSISTAFTPQLTQQVFGKLKEYSEVLQ